MQKYAKTASRLADWMEKNIPEGLTVFSFPADHRRRLRTTNGLERVNKEVHRRTQVVSIFPNEASCLRLISAVLIELDEEWQGGPQLSLFRNRQHVAVAVVVAVVKWATAALSQLSTCPQPGLHQNRKEPKDHQRIYRKKLALSREASSPRMFSSQLAISMQLDRRSIWTEEARTEPTL